MSDEASRSVSVISMIVGPTGLSLLGLAGWFGPLERTPGGSASVGTWHALYTAYIHDHGYEPIERDKVKNDKKGKGEKMRVLQSTVWTTKGELRTTSRNRS